LTDTDLVTKKLAQIETYVQQLRRLARIDEIVRDIREERFVEHTLQLAIQAALDAASRITSSERLGEPRTNRDLFELLSRNGWLPDSLVAPLRDMAGFRNVLVHGYTEVDPGIVRDVVEHRLDDFLAFASEIRRRLAEA
jgi:uncharacterized protein YutE (UPF0331/DUF86 family)